MSCILFTILFLGVFSSILSGLYPFNSMTFLNNENVIFTIPVLSLFHGKKYHDLSTVVYWFFSFISKFESQLIFFTPSIIRGFLTYFF